MYVLWARRLHAEHVPRVLPEHSSILYLLCRRRCCAQAAPRGARP
jgi:hypothetical protein